jgi:hypothetical protein
MPQMPAEPAAWLEAEDVAGREAVDDGSPLVHWACFN